MFKIIIALWFLMFVFKLFSRQSVTINLLNKTKEVIKELSPDDIKNNTQIKDIPKETSTKMIGLVFGMFILLVIYFLMFILNYIFMFSMIKYDSTYITLGYIAFSLITTVVAGRRASKSNTKKKTKEELVNEIDKIKPFTFTSVLIKVINVGYWGYAVYLLYFLNK